MRQFTFTTNISVRRSATNHTQETEMQDFIISASNSTIGGAS